MTNSPRPLGGTGSEPTAGTAIELVDVSVHFGDHIAIDGVTCRFHPGQSVAVIGPNGSGKTTLLGVITGLVEPTMGTLLTPDNTLFGYVSQHGSKPEWMPITAGDVVRMGRYRHRGLLGRITRDDQAIIQEAAASLEISDLLDRSYGELSGGQRQRVRIAQALATEPNVLVLDEPITGLDLTSQQIILDLIAQQTAQGTAVVLTTHHLDEARHCDRVLLVAGKIVADGPPDKVLTVDNLRATFGERLLGDHRHHDHDQSMLVVDDHGHQH